MAGRKRNLRDTLMKRNDPLPVGEIIRLAFEQAGNAELVERHRACSLWPQVVGPTINRFTTRRWIEGDTLHVAISNAALRNDLSFMQQTIMQAINKAAGKDIIAHIKFH